MEHYKRYTDSSRVLFPVMDALFIFGSFRIASHQVQGNWKFEGVYPLLFAVFALLWWTLSRQQVNVYRTDRLLSYTEKLMKLVHGFLLHALYFLASVVILNLNWLSDKYLSIVYGLSIGSIIMGRFLLTYLRRAYRRHLAQPYNRFVIIGASTSGQELYRFLTSHDPVSNQFKGYFTDSPVSKEVRQLVQGSLKELKAYCKNEKINEIYFALPLDQHELIQEISRFADDHFISFRIVPDYQGTMRQNVSVYYYDHLPVLTIRQAPLGFRTNQVPKRVFDIAFSLFVILGIFPIILPLLALLIKLDSPGPVFFQQLRPGKRHQLFPCYKLRTMRADHGRAELQATAA
ncbi:sugar transferase, partial [Hymenobacter sp.]|uniref:sugar transferase n=1 Tax=Hymenobacter sp. TaxID=1898978 RepID=UPI002ED7C40D